MEHRTDLGRATVGCNNTTKFSEVQTVASRNSLYRILAINVALGVEQRAKMQLYSTWIGLRKGHVEEIATANFGEFIFFPRTWVNRGERKRRGCLEASVSSGAVEASSYLGQLLPYYST